MSQQTRHERIIGLDPGIARTGFAVLERTGSSLTVLTFGCIETKAGTPYQERLHAIEQTVDALLKKFKPSFAALEKLYVTANTKTAMAVGQARGVLLLVLGRHGLVPHEFTPQQVKLSATGYGRAEKKQVQHMMQRMFKLPTLPKPDDAADALAIAFTASAIPASLR